MVPSIVDVTLRDGGYANDFALPLPETLKIVSTLPAAGVRMLEIGYCRPRLWAEPSVPGPKCCRPEYLRPVADAARGAKLLVMVHPAEMNPQSYRRLTDHGVGGVRLAVPSPVCRDLEGHVQAIHAAGLLCSVNLIRVSQSPIETIVANARAARDLGADWLYLADSNGSMFPEVVEATMREVRREVSITLGFHAHDSLRLAFANSLAAARGGAGLLDGTLGGMGKGAGNLATEMVAAHLKSCFRVQYQVADIVELALKVVDRWIPPDHERRCENALSALLDLNVDQIRTVAAASLQERCSMLSVLERELSSRRLASVGEGGT